MWSGTATGAHDPQLLKGVLSLLLLRLLADRESYGYEVVQRLRECGLVDISEGSVYPALSRLPSPQVADRKAPGTSRQPTRGSDRRLSCGGHQRPRRYAATGWCHIASEYGEGGRRPYWTAGLATFVVAYLILTWLLEAGTSAFRAGIAAGDPDATGGFTWNGIPS